MTELTREQVEQLANDCTEDLQPSQCDNLIEWLLTDASQRARLEGVEKERVRFQKYYEACTRVSGSLKQQLAAAQGRVGTIEVERNAAQRLLNESRDDLRGAREACAAQRTKIDVLTARLTQVEADLETQRTATYQAVEREHVTKKRLAQAEEALATEKKISNVRRLALEKGCLQCGYKPLTIKPMGTPAAEKEEG